MCYRIYLITTNLEIHSDPLVPENLLDLVDLDCPLIQLLQWIPSAPLHQLTLRYPNSPNTILQSIYFAHILWLQSIYSFKRKYKKYCGFNSLVFRLDALALSVIATATWLGGWLGGWVSVTAGIVSKRLNLSENILDHLLGPSFKHLGPLTPIPNSKGNPFIGGVKYTGVGKLAIFVRFSTYIAVYLGNGAR